MTAPTCRVFMGYGSNWRTPDASITWTEETANVLGRSGVDTDRGRSSVLDEFAAGRAKLVLKNDNRRFDPSHSTLGAAIKPGVPCRITAEVSGVQYQVLRGFVDRWPQESIPGNRYGRVPIAVTDGFRKLAGQQTSATLFAEVLAGLAPLRWYPLTDRPGSEIAANIGAYPENASNFGNLEFGAVSLDGGDSSTAFTTALNGGLVMPSRPPIDGEFTSVAFLVNTTAASGTIFYDDLAPGFEITFGSTAIGGHLQIGAGSYVFATAAGRINDGRTHLVVAAIDTSGGGGSLLYVDGINALSAFITGSVIGSTNRFNTIGPNFVGRLQHMAWWNVLLDAGDAVALNDAFTRLDGETTGQRLASLLDAAGWPSDLRAIAAGANTPMGPTTLGADILSLTRRVEAVEQGRLFIGRDGKATLLDRYHQQLVTAGNTVQASFVDAGAGIVYGDLAFDFDDELVRNRVRASVVNGPELVLTDETSIDSYGDISDDQLTDLDFVNEAQARSAAEWRLARYRNPMKRARPIVLKVHALPPAQQAIIFGLDIGHRVAVVRTPQGVGATETIPALVDGISHKVGMQEWITTLTVAPVDPVTYALWGSALWGSGVWGY